MSSKRSSGEESAGPRSALPGDADCFQRFRLLSHELLECAAEGLLRIDFLPMVATRIMEYSGLDAVELWVKEDPSKHFRCSVTAAKKMPFGFILVPCPLGEALSRTVERLALDVSLVERLERRGWSALRHRERGRGKEGEGAHEVPRPRRNRSGPSEAGSTNRPGRGRRRRGSRWPAAASAAGPPPCG